VKVLVTGSGGMVGQAVSDHCKSAGDDVLSYTHQALDIGDFNNVMKTLQAEKPDVVINCAAWTDVDGCELQPELAFETNALGPENLAMACREIDAVLVTISTDYVFNGRKEGFYTQKDQPDPESTYAMSKLDGERRAQAAYARTIVVRTGFVFGPGGTNFLSTIVERARRDKKLMAIKDAYGTPTYSRDLAVRLRELAALDVPGLYHVVNQGEGVSFADFARQAVELAGCDGVEIQAVSMDSLKRPAARPHNSRLRCLRSEAIGLPALRDWRSALKEYVGSAKTGVPVQERGPAW
jgi:dTDP-4-dehydrorhamnose reductase